jgi:hypothetical protein
VKRKVSWMPHALVGAEKGINNKKKKKKKNLELA